MKRFIPPFDVGRGLVALGIAIALFAVVRNETIGPELGSYEVPIELVDVPPGLLLAAGESSPSARVRVSAPRESLMGLHSSSFRAFVDLRRGTSGVHEYPLSVEPPDPRIRLIEVVPSRIRVRLEETTDRRVPVHVSRVGTTPFGYEAGAAQVEPVEVLIAGPTSLVRRIASWGVDLRLEGVTVDIDRSYSGVPLDSQGQPVPLEGRHLQVTPESARVRVPVVQQVSYKTVPVRPDVAGNVQNGWVIEGISADPASVALVGPPRSLATVDFARTERIDATEANSNFARQVGLVVPDGVSVLQSDVVRVTVRVAPLILAQSITVTAAAQNLSPGLQLVGTVPTVELVVQGSAAAFRRLDFADLRARVDVGGLGPGTHLVPVRVILPVELTLVATTPEIVAIALEEAESPAPPRTPPRPEGEESAATSVPVPEDGAGGE